MENTKDLRNEIYTASNRLDDAKFKFLKATGWTLSCNFPGGCWMWQKEIDGRLVAVNTDQALRFEDFLQII